VVFGTRKYGGLGLEHLTAVEEFEHLQYLIGSLGTQDTTGDLYKMLLEYTQLECGTATPILEAIFGRKEHAILTKTGSRSVGDTSHCATPTKGRLRDVALMDEFTRQGLSNKQMRDANKYRIYLLAFYVSDTTDLGGKSIEKWAK
jgi:hypothetical protein